MLRIVPYYAAALALLYVYLSFRVIQVRRSAKQAIGNGGVADLERRARVHANFAEYVPFALVLLAMAELRGAWAPLLHGLCLLLVAGRCTHAWGVPRTPEDFRFRIRDMMATFAALICAAVLILATRRRPASGGRRPSAGGRATRARLTGRIRASARP